MMIFNDGRQAQGEALPKISRMMTGSLVAVAHKKAAWFHAAGLQLPGANYHGGLAEKVTATVPIVKGCGSLHEATLPAAVRHGTIHPAGGLDTHQHGWRIRHPQAVTRHRKICNHFPIPGNLPWIFLYLGAWVGSQRKRPHCAVPLFRHCLAATRSALFNEQGIPQMIFTFLIASSACRLADLRRIRTVTAVADTEAQARAALAGLPLVFLSRTPTGRAAA